MELAGSQIFSGISARELRMNVRLKREIKNSRSCVRSFAAQQRVNSSLSLSLSLYIYIYIYIYRVTRESPIEE